MPVIGICALCNDKADLRKSHIIPAFFGSYLKKTSATGYLRSGEAPNLRVQDLQTRVNSILRQTMLTDIKRT